MQMATARVNWIIVTPSYPPDQGGIADYSWVLARELARRGDGVNLWTGPHAESDTAPSAPGISVFHLPAHFSLASCRILEREIARLPEPKRILLQYAPQPFGPRAGSRFKGIPLWFTRWLLRQQAAPLWTMVHEAETENWPGMPWKSRVLHSVSRRMIGWTLSVSERAFYAMPAAERILRGHAGPASLDYLPVPSNVDTNVVEAEVAQERTRLLAGGAQYVVGHFGTYSPEITRLLEPVLKELLDTQPFVQVQLVGQGSCEFAAGLRKYHRRVVATGTLEPRAVARHLAACDLLVQPFPDGVSTRRGSVMAGIALGVPVLSNVGGNSERVWIDTGALAMSDIAQMPERIQSLLADAEQRESIGAAGRILYQQMFSLDRTVDTLRSKLLQPFARKGPAASRDPLVTP